MILWENDEAKQNRSNHSQVKQTDFKSEKMNGVQRWENSLKDTTVINM